MKLQAGLILSLALLLAACGSHPVRTGASSGGYLPGDGPGTEDATRLAAVPEAVPHYEPLHRYANRPYDALGVHYVPLTTSGHYKERGIASWYGKKFHGQRTSSGEVYDMYAMTAAHKTLPIPSYARVTNLANGRSVIVRVNDRGPFVRGRLMDVSYAAAYKLDMIKTGSAEVEVESILPGEDLPAVHPVLAEPVQVEALPPALPLTPGPAAPQPQAVSTAPAPRATDDGGTVFLQLGSFKSAQSAQEYLAQMHARLGDLGKELTLLTRDGLTRVHLGPYRSTEEARASADLLAPRLGFKPFVSLH